MTTVESGSTSSITIFSLPPSFFLLSQAHHYITLKLNSSNYLLWCPHIDPYLQGQHLFGYVTGEFPHPPSLLPSIHSSTSSTTSSIPNPAAQTWDTQNKILTSLLISSLNEDVVLLTIWLTSSAEIWSTLSTVFASPSNTRVIHLSMELYSPHKHDETLAAYFHHLKRISDELSAAEWPVSQSDFMVVVLKGFRAEFVSQISRIHDRYSSAILCVTQQMSPPWVH